jgi:hypothetical protein
MSSPPPQPAKPPVPVWWEIGRPSPGEAPDWITWVAPLGDHGEAFYRSLVVADGSIVVTVELHLRRGSRHQTIHRGRCGLSQDAGLTPEGVRSLLTAADEAVERALKADRKDEGAALERERPTRGEEQGVSAAWQELEHHLRERAYFLWEREGRPEGRAHEYWERARRGEARAA